MDRRAATQKWSLDLSKRPRAENSNITSLGRSPLEADELELEFVSIWASLLTCLLTCVISAWMIDGLRLWSWATAAFGVVLRVFLGGMIAEPPAIRWDGQDSNGERIGSMEVATADVGAVLWPAGVTERGTSLIRKEHPCEEFADLGVGVEGEDAGDILVGADHHYGAVTADAALVVDVLFGQSGEDLLHILEVELAHMWTENRRNVRE